VNSKAEEIVSRSLRTLLRPLPVGASIEDSDEFITFQTALTRVIPSTLGETYDCWRHEGLDWFRFAVAHKLGPEEAEFVGLCLLVGNQAWIPLHLRLRIASENNCIDWLECKVGELGNDGERVTGTPFGSTRETKLLYSVVNRLGSIPWTYQITRGSPPDAV
jgi:hypothetical protein